MRQRRSVRPGRGKPLGPKVWKPRPVVPCVHCGVMGTRPRGLCWRCHSDYDIRQIYRSTTDSGTPTTGGLKHGEPTMALPGTEEKIRVLEERAANGLALFHPRDARPGMTDDQEKHLRLLGLLEGLIADAVKEELEP